jgi:peptidoglycan/xylan/chitin deacetylase (PgdA/CDA1 family)
MSAGAVATAAAAAPTLPARPASAGAVMLTFDAGADRGYAEDILDTLADEHVVASFGITGNWAKANPDLVRRMASDGHLVFNHTLDHRSFTGTSDSLGGLSAAARRTELDNADAIIAPLIGHSTRPFYRLPYGDDDARVANDVAPDGYTRKIGWTVDSQGWRGLQSADILARCMKLAAPGAVYVFHVGRESQDAIALPQIIRGLRERGFSFKRVD